MEPLKEATAIKSEISRVIASTAYQTYEKRLLKEVKENKVPHHVAVIMDGNRRFAKEFGLTPAEGHIKGKDKLEEVLDWCMELGVKVLTVYAFSTENFNRDESEVDSLMQMFEENFYRLAKDERVHRNGIRVRVLGQRDLLPDNVLKAIEVAESSTAEYSNFHYNLATAYGSRQEILQAIKQIAQQVKDGALEVPTCPIPTSYSGRRGRSASPTSCCGSWHTPSCTSPTCTGRDSGRSTSCAPSAPTSFGSVGSANDKVFVKHPR